MAREFMGFEIEIPTPQGPLKVSADPNKAGDTEAAQAALRLVLESGLMNSAPPSLPAPQIPASPRLSEVLARLTARKANRRILPSTLKDYASSIAEFVSWKGDVQIRSVTGRDIGDFGYHLREERRPPISARTWDKKLNALNMLFAQAALDGDWDKKDEYPTAGHFLFKKKRRAHTESAEAGYRAFTEDELRKIFDPKSFLSKSIDPHEYWLPILGYLTGARLNELAQLMVADIKELDGVWVIHITDSGHPNKRVKTDSGRRMVPIHPKLRELGFLDYANIVSEFGATDFRFNGMLFPYLTYSEKNGFGGAPSKRFGRYLSRIGLKDSQLVFHSLRKSFNQILINQQVHVEHRSRLLGQAFDSVNSEVYGTDLPLDQVLRNIIAPIPASSIDVSALRLDGKDFAKQLSKLSSQYKKELERLNKLEERTSRYKARERRRLPTCP